MFEKLTTTRTPSSWSKHFSYSYHYEPTAVTTFVELAAQYPDVADIGVAYSQDGYVHYHFPATAQGRDIYRRVATPDEARLLGISIFSIKKA